MCCCLGLLVSGIMAMLESITISKGTATAFTIPTDLPEADGTFAWDSTTLILVELEAGGVTGIGYSYSHQAAAVLARDVMRQALVGKSALDIPAAFERVRRLQRNYGREGVAASALSAIDVALWDLKAKLLGVSLVALLGQVRDGATVYGSGGFTTYTDEQLAAQMAGWVGEGITRVKMKVGTHPDEDCHRVEIARRAIGAEAHLFVDANGAYARKQALSFAERFGGEWNVRWFEEPVSSDDLSGLRLLRDRVPGGMEVAAGEYGWDAMSLKRMLEAEAVDVLQADAPRCGGVTGFLQVAALAQAHPLPLSAHCAPSIHLHVACAAQPLRHVEYFHDHVRIERMLFDGFCAPRGGVMYPDLSRPGLGLDFKHADAEQFHDDL